MGQKHFTNLIKENSEAFILILFFSSSKKGFSHRSGLTFIDRPILRVPGYSLRIILMNAQEEHGHLDILCVSASEL